MSLAPEWGARGPPCRMNPEPWVFPVVAGPEGSQVWLAKRMPTGPHHSPPHHPRGGCPAHILHTQTCMIHKRSVPSVDFTYFLGHFVRLQLRKMWHRASNTLLYGSRHFPVANSHVQIQRTLHTSGLHSRAKSPPEPMWPCPHRSRSSTSRL